MIDNLDTAFSEITRINDIKEEFIEKIDFAAQQLILALEEGADNKSVEIYKEALDTAIIIVERYNTKIRYIEDDIFS